MKNTHLKMICWLLMIFPAVGIKAQTNTANDEQSVSELRHEIALYGGGGMSALNYSLDMGGSKTDGAGGISGFAGIAYTWNINYHFGIVTGLELASYGAKTTYDAISGEKMYGEGNDRLNFQYSMNNYIEEQGITFLSVPVMLQYSVPLHGTKKFYVAGGLKLELPVNPKATIFPGTVNTLGYYSFENQTYTDLSKYGFYSNHKPGSIENDIDMSISIAASLETGVRFLLTKKILLYTGAYLDYGLNDVRSTKDKDIIAYQEFDPSVLKYASILNTSHASKVKIFGAGLKVKVSFGWGTK
jgi:hypothetical protein